MRSYIFSIFFHNSVCTSCPPGTAESARIPKAILGYVPKNVQLTIYTYVLFQTIRYADRLKYLYKYFN